MYITYKSDTNSDWYDASDIKMCANLDPHYNWRKQ